MNLINNILQVQIKTLSQSPCMSSAINNAWTLVNNSTATRPHRSTLTSTGQTTVNQYSIQTANRFAALSNLTESWQSKRSSYSSNYAQTQRGVPNINNKKFKGMQGKKSSSLDHSKLTHVNPNLSSPRMNENKQSCIPTIVNGVTSVTSSASKKIVHL